MASIVPMFRTLHFLVVLSEHLLNKFNTIRGIYDQTIMALEQPVRAQPIVQRQKQHRLRPAEAVAIIQGYRAGASMRVLGERYGVHESTVCTLLKRMGVAARTPVVALSPADISEAARLYGDGWSLSQLGRRYGCTHTTVWRALTRHGVTLRPRPGLASS